MQALDTSGGVGGRGVRGGPTTVLPQPSQELACQAILREATQGSRRLFPPPPALMHPPDLPSPTQNMTTCWTALCKARELQSASQRKQNKTKKLTSS